jgi:hypothetical protein
MAIDNLGVTYENRTLQFYGLAYGNSNVSLTATINGTTVFSGEVPTINSPVPAPPVDFNEVILFSTGNSTLFPTNYSGAYPMSITVTGGYGAIFRAIKANYVVSSNVNTTVMENSSISGNVLTVGTVSSGNVSIGQILHGTGIVTATRILSGSDATWIVNNSQTVPNTTITGITPEPGVADRYGLFNPYYDVDPTIDVEMIEPRSNVTIDGIPQPPPPPGSRGIWGWIVPTGSTIAHNLNVSTGNCAQA